MPIRKSKNKNKRNRSLNPESVYARHKLEQWLQDDLNVKAEHRRRIWKHALVVDSNGDDDDDDVEMLIRTVPDLPNVVKERFGDKFVVTTSRVVEIKTSSPSEEQHGAKLVIELQDGHLIETVIIQNTPTRSTVCVSSQVGCQMGCTFCATGTMGHIANLTAAEIVEQVHHARKQYVNNSTIRGVVMMGMGEPLDNYDNVIEAIHSLADPACLGGEPIPLRRITVSTVGVVHGITKLARTCPQIQLALSLHAPNDTIRQRIVPTARAFSITKIFKAVQDYQAAGGRSVMIEYIMIDAVNSSTECAHELGALLQGRKCMVNLIPYNPTEAGDRYGFSSPSDAVLREFADVLLRHYVDDKNKPLRCTIRWSSRRGQDMDAACGQLALQNLKINNTTSTCQNNTNNNRASISTTSNDIEDLGTRSLSSSQRRHGTPARNGKDDSDSMVKKTTPDADKNKSANIKYCYVLLMVSGAALLGLLLVKKPKKDK